MGLIQGVRARLEGSTTFLASIQTIQPNRSLVPRVLVGRSMYTSSFETRKHVFSRNVVGDPNRVPRAIGLVRGCWMMKSHRFQMIPGHGGGEGASIVTRV